MAVDHRSKYNKSSQQAIAVAMSSKILVGEERKEEREGSSSSIARL
jgi:hypothetical protein